MKKECTIFYCGEGIWESSYWMNRTGSDPNGIRIMTEKDQIFPVYISQLYFAAGNILKQDLLSLGGDAAVHKFFVNAKKEYGSVLLLGTAKHYRLLQTKMYAQHWGLKELAADLKIVMENLLYYRNHQSREIIINETFVWQEICFESDAECRTECQVEWLMSRLPLRRASKEGYARIAADPLFQKLGAEVSGSENTFFYAALSRGYYIGN